MQDALAVLAPMFWKYAGGWIDTCSATLKAVAEASLSLSCFVDENKTNNEHPLKEPRTKEVVQVTELGP